MRAPSRWVEVEIMVVRDASLMDFLRAALLQVTL
jgi:hypothetical protein